MAYSHKAIREDMSFKPGKKLLMVERHFLLLVVTIILVSEGDVMLTDSLDPVIGNRCTMGVSAQVLHHLFGSTKWLFGVHFPVFLSSSFNGFFDLLNRYK